MKNKITVLVGFLLLTTIASCSNRSELQDKTGINNFSLNDTTSIPLKTVVFCTEAPSFLIAFDTVFNDSRCPIDATCIWEGNAEIGISITHNKEMESIRLNTHKNTGSIKETFGYEIELIDLSPYPGTKNLSDNPVNIKIKVVKK